MIYYPEKIEEASKKTNFLDFLKEVWKEDSHQLSRLEFLTEDWKTIEEALSTAIKNGLNSLKTDTSNLTVPDAGLKGVYFCLGDDARSLDISGSLYYNEMDWAGNSDFYGDTGDVWKILDTLIDNLKEHGVNHTTSEYVVFLLMSYLVLKTLPDFPTSYLLKNAGMAIGFSDGDELLLGYFCDGKFTRDIKLVENGEYENPASFTIEIAHFEPRGPLWEYIQHNFTSFLTEHNLYDDFMALGEKEATRICQAYPKELFVNRCAKCDFIKKTPKASLCLGCGDFSPPLMAE